VRRSSHSLLPIIAFARAGALSQAWRLFRAAGFDHVTDDPAVLALRGRLLKDEALATSGLQQRSFYKKAADSYARAADLNGNTYPLINAATLSLLAGKPRKARSLARSVLDRHGEDAETPYWREATRAEALLLLEKANDARNAFALAVSKAPQAYEDHASTLRQLGLILNALRLDKSWLDKFRPPRCLHFAGPLTLAPGEEKSLGREIRTILGNERTGFGFGALAAGTDILIAEALLEAGAELHVVLPSSAASFRESSVTKYGRRWGSRFDEVLWAAATLRTPAEPEIVPFALAIRLAAEVAMGRAAMQAATLQTEALQLVVLAKETGPERDGSASAWMSAKWRKSGRRNFVLRGASPGGHSRAQATPRHKDVGVVAALRIELPDLLPEDSARLLRRVAGRLADRHSRQFAPPRWTGDAILLVYSSVEAAAEGAYRALGKSGADDSLRIAGHYGIAHRLKDPFSRTHYVGGQIAELPRQILLSTPSGALHVSEDFAAAMYASGSSCRAEYIGDLPVAGSSPLRLFAIR
jgi:hypothetical protein